MEMAGFGDAPAAPAAAIDFAAYARELAAFALMRVGNASKARPGGDNSKCQLNQVAQKIIQRPLCRDDVVYSTSAVADGSGYRSTVQLTEDVEPLAVRRLTGPVRNTEKEAEHAAALDMLKLVANLAADSHESRMIHRPVRCRDGTNCPFSDCDLDHGRLPACRYGMNCRIQPGKCVFLHPRAWYRTYDVRGRAVEEGPRWVPKEAVSEEQATDDSSVKLCSRGRKCRVIDCDQEHNGERPAACWHGVQCTRNAATCLFSHPRVWYQSFTFALASARSKQNERNEDERIAVQDSESEHDDDGIPPPDGLEELVRALRETLGSVFGAPPPPPPPHPLPLLPPPPPPAFVAVPGQLPEPPQSARSMFSLFLPKVPENVDKAALFEIFSAYGNPRCYCYPNKPHARITFKNSNVVNDLVAAGKVALPDGRQLRVVRYTAPSSATDQAVHLTEEVAATTSSTPMQWLGASSSAPKASLETATACPSAPSTPSSDATAPADAEISEDEQVAIVFPARRRWGGASAARIFQ